MKRQDRLIVVALGAIVGVLAVAPVARLILAAFEPGLGIAARVFADPATWVATVHSLEVTIGGTMLALGLGAVMTAIVALSDVRAKPVLVFGFVVPLMIPPQVTAIAWLQVFGPSSALLKLLGLAPPLGSPNPLYSRGGIVALLGIHYAPLVFLTLRAGLRLLPRDLVDAARATGAAPRHALATVIVPLMLPPLAAGAILAAVSCLGNFGIPALLGIPGRYPVLTTLIYQRLAGLGTGVLAEVAVLSVWIGVLVILGLVVQTWLPARTRHAARGGVEPSRFALRSWRPIVEIAAWAIVIFTLALPLAAMVLTSLLPAPGVKLTGASATAANYAYVVLEHEATQRAFINSFLLAAGGALALVLVCVPLGYFSAWRPGPLLRALTIAAEIPYALPGVVLAIACILLFLKPLPLTGWSLYNTLWIILFAYLARFLTLALRPVIAGYHQLDRALDEAAQTCGAPLFYRLRTVVAPLVAPAAAAGALIVFLTAFNELTVSALLWSSGAETLGVAVFNLEQGGESPAAAALAALTVAATILLMAAASALARLLPRGTIPWQG